MACILKPPAGAACGVVTLTTQERDRFVNRDRELRRSIEALKDRWLVGLHHNWHDFEFRYDPLFDFSMAGDDDLREVSGRRFPLVPLDACNFCPDEFYPGGEKFWDILFVGHPVFFKRVPVLFATIRELFDRGHDFRALHICAMPSEPAEREPTFLHDVRERYEALFDARERRLFTLLTTDFDYPFPFDLPTLAHFYRSSRVFIHPADEERRCRVAAYAWAAGSPVVGMASIGSLLPAAVRSEPWFCEVREGTAAEYADQIERALEIQRAGFDPVAGRRMVSVEYTVPALEEHLQRIAQESARPLSAVPVGSHALDIRLGRHHGIGHNPNSVPQTIADFVRYLAERTDVALARDLKAVDPERAIAALPEWRSAGSDVEAGLYVDVTPGAVEKLAQRVVGKTRLLLRQSGLTRH
jgi:glycosyltransferase involved in cell wall biosynthesis